MDYNEKDVLWYMASGILTFFATSFVRFFFLFIYLFFFFYLFIYFFLMKVYANSMGYNIAYANLKVYPKKEQEKQETHI